MTTWEATLRSRLPARVSGTVAAVAQGGRTQASARIEGGDAQATYGWRIRVGGCDTEGDPVGGQGLYGELVTGLSGSATADANLTSQLDADGRYAAWVHLALPGGGETVVACGELERTD